MLASLSPAVSHGQDTDGVVANPALKQAQDNYFAIIGSLTPENRAAFMKWCQEGVELPLEDGSLASLKPPPPPEGTPNTNVHTGVTCDMSGMSPIVGNRWKKITENYDLCEAEYQKLGEKEKAEFVCLPGG